MRIEPKEVLIRGLCLFRVRQVALINFPFCQQSTEAVPGAGILAPQKFILADGVVQRLFVLEHAAFFGEQIGDSGDGGIGFGRARVAVVDRTVGGEDAIVLQAGALLLRAAFESFAQTLGNGGIAPIAPIAPMRSGNMERLSQFGCETMGRSA